MIPSHQTPITFVIQHFHVREVGDLSLVLAGSGSSVSLAATSFSSSCTSAICTCTLTVVLPQNTEPGTYTLNIASRKCANSQLLTTISAVTVKAVPYPERVPEEGGANVVLYMENAPDYGSDFDTELVRLDCDGVEAGTSSEMTITSTIWDPMGATRVHFRSSAFPLVDEQSHKTVNCKIFRRDDVTQAGAMFSLTSYHVRKPFFRHEPSQTATTGNQFGGEIVTLQIANFPRPASNSDVSVKFGSVLSSSVWFDKLTTEGDALIRVGSLQISDPTTVATTPVQTVRISWASDPFIYVEFDFTYLWAYAPVITGVSPAFADISGNAMLVLQVADIDPRSAASDLVVVFQGSAEQACSSLQVMTSSDQSTVWQCTVSTPALQTPSNGPSELELYTVQQGRQKSGACAFTFTDIGVPLHVSQSATEGAISGSKFQLVFENYCNEHTLEKYNVSFSTAGSSRPAEVISHTYTASPTTGCRTMLTIVTPTMNEAFASTGTMTPDGNTQKALTFSFGFLAKVVATASIKDAKVILGSIPEVEFTVSNMKSSGVLCSDDNCYTEHDIVVQFDGQVGVLLQPPSSCYSGECKLKASPPQALNSVGPVTVVVTNHVDSVVSDDTTAQFEFEVFEYNCAAYCRNQGKVENAVEIQQNPPLSEICMDQYCKVKPIRNPLITYMSSSTCGFVYTCTMNIVVSQVTSQVLTQENLNGQLTVSFGNPLDTEQVTAVTTQSQPRYKEAVSVLLLRQDGDEVELQITTPTMPNPVTTDLRVNGYDELSAILRATRSFKFGAVASGPISFVQAFPVEGPAVAGNTESMLSIQNVPIDVQSSEGAITLNLVLLHPAYSVLSCC